MHLVLNLQLELLLQIQLRHKLVLRRGALLAHRVYLRGQLVRFHVMLLVNLLLSQHFLSLLELQVIFIVHICLILVHKLFQQWDRLVRVTRVHWHHMTRK